MADPVAAAWACRVVGMHIDLIQELINAEHAAAMPVPTLGGSVSQSREPDDRMLVLVERRLEHGSDPEHLDPVRHLLADRLGRMADWYHQHAHQTLDLDAWHPLATRFGRLIGDPVAASALVTCLLHHARIGHDDQHRKNARERWRRLAIKYVEVLDEQRRKGRTDQAGRPVIQTVEGEGERRIG